MLNRFKDAMVNVMSGANTLPDTADSDPPKTLKKLKYPYARPDFLKLNADEVQVSADHSSRPILVPRDISRIPWGSGYAEVINAGKSKHNEDQACAGLFFVHGPADRGASSTATSLAYFKEKLKFLDLPFDLDVLEKDPLPFTYFSIFDGHAGTGAALMAVNTLHNIIKEKLSDIRDLLIIKRYGLDEQEARVDPSTPTTRNVYSAADPVTADSLVIGALESAFFQMDDLIGKEKQGYRVSGGCTALVALFFMGKLYVANAGDCRAIIVQGEAERTTVVRMSEDFTPVTERQRLQLFGEAHPHLIHPEFTHLDFVRRVMNRDIGKQVLYRTGKMKGWAYKTVTAEDIKFPLVFGDGKRARLLATIGVTRGFGDHDLKVYDTNVFIKPFLTAMPEVRMYDICDIEHTEDDVLIMGSDGLWDVLSNRQAAEIVRLCLQEFPAEDQARYTSAAQELVLNARGLLKNGWQTPDNRQGSGDDITAFVIPLHRYAASPSQSSSTESALDSKTAVRRTSFEVAEEVVEDIEDIPEEEGAVKKSDNAEDEARVAAKEKIEGSGENVKEKVEESGENVKEKMEESRENVKEKMEESGGDAAERIRAKKSKNLLEDSDVVAKESLEDVTKMEGSQKVPEEERNAQENVLENVKDTKESGEDMKETVNESLQRELEEAIDENSNGQRSGRKE